MPPAPPYYATIFTSTRTPGENGYGAMAERMERLTRQQRGFLGIESARGADGLGITVCYWNSLEELHAWGRHPEHLEAQKLGRELWYESYSLRIAKVESERG
jgi:heme-degrading monooxygenase HmoA